MGIDPIVSRHEIGTLMLRSQGIGDKRRRPLLRHYAKKGVEPTVSRCETGTLMLRLSKPPFSYAHDLCVGVPISLILTMGSTFI